LTSTCPRLDGLQAPDRAIRGQRSRLAICRSIRDAPGRRLTLSNRAPSGLHAAQRFPPELRRAGPGGSLRGARPGGTGAWRFTVLYYVAMAALLPVRTIDSINGLRPEPSTAGAFFF
jgi:hypothetical protein